MEIKTTQNEAKIGKLYEDRWSAEEVAVIKSAVAKNTTDRELAYFLGVCRSTELNPLNKEVWCYKDNKGNLIILTGRDGFLAKAQTNPVFNGIRSAEVCKNDEFEMDIANAVIRHKPNYQGDRGEIVGAYCMVFRKGGEPTIEWASMKRYNKGYNVWKSHPEAMIKKVAEANALKKAFGINGVQSEYEFNVDKGVAVPMTNDSDEKQWLTPTHPRWDFVKAKAVAEAPSIDEVREFYNITDENYANLLS